METRWLGGVSYTLLFFGLVVLTSVGVSQSASPRPTPESALESLKKALEGNDWKTVAAVLAHPKESRALVPQTLIEAWLRAQSASTQLETALRELAQKTGSANPQAAAQHPFSAYLAPPGDFVLQILDVESASQATRLRARVKCQYRGQSEEETVAVVRLGNNWYVTPPTPLRKLFAGAEDTATADRHSAGLNKLADLLTETAQLVRSGQLKDRQAVLEHILRRFHENQLAELLR